LRTPLIEPSDYGAVDRLDTLDRTESIAANPVHDPGNATGVSLPDSQATHDETTWMAKRLRFGQANTFGQTTAFTAGALDKSIG
jgi:hypothetical protein|tara:strand:+ start:1391 stop:1642 length:252 start_codon:yes stop_codon:yes gene_type:complete